MKILDIILYKIKDIFKRLYIIEKWKNNISIPEPSYKVYTALLTQSGTNAPVATVLQNTIGEITWTYDDVGLYSATCSGCFTENKTMAILSLWGDDNVTPKLGYSEWVSVNNIYLRLLNMAQNPDNILGWSNILTSIEIRVYQ